MIISEYHDSLPRSSSSSLLEVVWFANSLRTYLAKHVRPASTKRPNLHQDKAMRCCAVAFNKINPSHELTGSKEGRNGREMYPLILSPKLACGYDGQDRPRTFTTSPQLTKTIISIFSPLCFVEEEDWWGRWERVWFWGYNYYYCQGSASEEDDFQMNKF